MTSNKYNDDNIKVKMIIIVLKIIIKIMMINI